MKIAIGVVSCNISLCISCFAASTMMDNLGSTTAKMSTININKDSVVAGQVLDSFYTASKFKPGKDSATVYLSSVYENGVQSEKTLCNAESRRIKSGVSEVPALKPESSGDLGGNGLPVGTGIAIAGILGIGLLRRKDGYFSNFGQDVDTVVDAAHHPVDTVHDVWNYISNTNQGTDPYPSGNGSSFPSPSDEVENDAAVTPHNCYPSGHCQQ